MQLFSSREIFDLAVSVVAITLIFSYPRLENFTTYLIIIFVSFVLHELAHKFAAQKFGAVAVYKMWVQGILLGLLTMFLPFRFVAPGAVEIYQYKFAKWKKRRFGFGNRGAGKLTLDEMGVIAVVGPLVNLVIAAVASLFPSPFFNQLAFLNSFLAFFNILPMRPLDGSKILEWRPWVWFFLQVLSIALLAFKLF